MREDDLVLGDLYLRAFDRFEVLELGIAQFQRAAELRARLSLGTPDALRLAAAQLAEYSELWTNAPRLAAPSHGLAIHVIVGEP